MKIILSTSIFALSAIVSSAYAASVIDYKVVYDNNIALAAATNGRVNDPDYSIPIEHADNFTFLSASKFSRATWAGTYEGNIARPDSFSLRIFTLTSGAPNLTPLYSIPLVGVIRSDSGLNNPFGQRKYSYQADFPELSLNAGTYAVSFYNNVSDGYEWYWATRDSPSVNGSYMYLSVWGAWHAISGGPEFSFALFTVPEPRIPVFAGACMIAIASRRRRDKDKRTSSAGRIIPAPLV